MSKLALLGGEKAVKTSPLPPEMTKWPIINKEMEDNVLDVLRRGAMSGSDVTKKFEDEYAKWHGMKYAVGANNGTAALQCAYYGAGIGVGDEVICPSITYWASCLSLYSLGATVVFADIDATTLCLDPKDFERKITKKTKAVIVVHYIGYPAEMDAILAIAKKHKVKVIEDASHAHGSLYKGKIVGSFGDASGFSLMSGKAFAIGEAGIMLTDDREIYERAITFGFYERHKELTIDYLKAGKGIPWGGYKYRMHQMSAAVGLAQLKKYGAETAEIDKAMNFFWDRLYGVPGIHAHRPVKGSGSTMGGWYNARGLYRKEEIDGLSISRFCEALRAEGFPSHPGCNKALHVHPLFNTIDVYGHGKPTRIVNNDKSVIQPIGSLPVAEGLQSKVFSIPWFKKFNEKILVEYADAVKKVVDNHKELLKDDKGDQDEAGGWGLTFKF